MKKTTLSSIFALMMMLFAFNASAQTNVLLNGNFETGTVGTAPDSWTTTTASTIVSMGLGTGSLQSAQVGTTAGALSQTFTTNVGTEFSFDCYFAVQSPTGDRTFKIVIGSDKVTMRVSTGGIFQFYTGGVWKTQTLTASTPAIQFCTDNNSNGLIDAGDVVKAYRIKLVFHKWALTDANFDFYLSDANNSTLNLVASGLTVFHNKPAEQLPSINFLLSTATKSFLVDEVSLIKNQVITFNALTPKFTTDADFDLTATSSAGLPVTYSSSNQNVATVTGSTVHIVGAGETNIVASSAATADYTAAADVTQKLTVSVATGLSSTSATKVYVVNRKLVVTGTTEEAKVFTVTGAQVDAVKALQPGLYIVKVGQQTAKVLVK